MYHLPESVENKVNDPAYTREGNLAVAATLTRLGCQRQESFRTFYERYAGPFEGSLGFTLLDLLDQPENIVTQTDIARKEHGFLERHLVISNYLGNAVLVYDCESDVVFEVDFEGADRALLAGTLEPRWESFEAFLVDFFS
jgi:hypothetical protein